jgi:hypothetical protein
MRQKEIIIATNIVDDYEDWEEGFKEFCEINGLDEKERDLYEYIEDTQTEYLYEEIRSFEKPCGHILAIADLGLWDGRHQGYQVIKTCKVNGIFKVGNRCDYYKWYCDRYNVRGEFIHHDGTNYVLFREIKDGVNIDTLLQKIYDGETIDSKTLSKYTKSMRPYIQKVYGFK